MSDFDSNPFADPEANNPFAVSTKFGDIDEWDQCLCLWLDVSCLSFLEPNFGRTMLDLISLKVVDLDPVGSEGMLEKVCDLEEVSPTTCDGNDQFVRSHVL